MKRLSVILFGIILVLLTSCQMSFNNFNKQKFTQLKSLKPAKEEHFVEGERKSNTVLNTLREYVEPQPVQLNDIKPLKDMVKRSLDNSDLIIVKIDGQYYQLRDPEYDIIYETLRGQLVAISSDSFASKDHLELLVDKKETGRDNLHTIFLKDISEANFVEGKAPSSYSTVKAPAEEKRSDSPATTQKRSRKSLEYAPDHEIHSSRNVQTAQKLRSAGRISMLAGTSGIGLLFASMTFFAIALIALGFVIAFSLMIAVAVYMKRYKNECREAGIQQSFQNKIMKRSTWVGLFFLSLPFLFLPFLLALAIVAAQGKRT